MPAYDLIPRFWLGRRDAWGSRGRSFNSYQPDMHESLAGPGNRITGAFPVLGLITYLDHKWSDVGQSPSAAPSGGTLEQGQRSRRPAAAREEHDVTIDDPSQTGRDPDADPQAGDASQNQPARYLTRVEWLQIARMGLAAGRAGQPSTTCPWRAPTDRLDILRKEAWIDGWLWAKDDNLELVINPDYPNYPSGYGYEDE